MEITWRPDQNFFQVWNGSKTNFVDCHYPKLGYWGVVHLRISPNSCHAKHELFRLAVSYHVPLLSVCRYPNRFALNKGLGKSSTGTWQGQCCHFQWECIFHELKFSLDLLSPMIDQLPVSRYKQTSDDIICFSPFSVSHWLLLGHMTSDNKTAFRQKFCRILDESIKVNQLVPQNLSILLPSQLKSVSLGCVRKLRASSYEPSNRAGSVTGTSFIVSVFIWEISARSNGMKFKKQKCIVRVCRSFVDSCNFTNKGKSYSSEVEILSRQKLGHFGHCVAKAKLFCQKSFFPVTRAGVSIWENFLRKPRSR